MPLASVLWLLMLLFTGFDVQAQTIYYVSVSNGNDANDGTTTTTPFKTLQKAIAATQANTDASVEIHVEAGVYKPTDGTSDATNRDATFNLTRGFQTNTGKA